MSMFCPREFLETVSGLLKWGNDKRGFIDAGSLKGICNPNTAEMLLLS